MRMPFQRMQPVLAFAAAHLDEDLSLDALAGKAGLSAWHFERTFAAAVGETPKQLEQRLRLGRAAAMLLAGGDSVLDGALDCGFQSHEVFCRAFRRRFGMAPGAYRARGFADRVDAAQIERHAWVVEQAGPCVGLFYTDGNGTTERNQMAYSITKQEMAPQPVLLARRRVKRSEIAHAIAEALPRVFLYAQQHGIALAGLPLTRYLAASPGTVTIEPGMRIASGAVSTPDDADIFAGTIFAGTLPGGPVATTMHAGPYEGLPDAYAAIEQWIEAEGLAASGPPWECYVNDPGDFPDPKDWKTEVFWPLTR